MESEQRRDGETGATRARQEIRGDLGGCPRHLGNNLLDTIQIKRTLATLVPCGYLFLMSFCSIGNRRFTFSISSLFSIGSASLRYSWEFAPASRYSPSWSCASARK